MRPTHPARGLPGLRLLLALALLVGIVLLRSAPSSASTSVAGPSAELVPGLRGVPIGSIGGGAGTVAARGDRDGVLPDGATAFDDRYLGIAGLDDGLLRALRRATRAAAGDGVAILVTSGWRSEDYQARLLHEAIADYGSEEEAARWVATPATSPHVAGRAVDVGHADAIAWLVAHGPVYGLCQIYRNEPWHFELRDTGPGRCPRMYGDPAHDPRLER